MTAYLGMSSLGLPSSGVQAIAESSALRIVDCLFAGTLIALFAGAVSRLSPKQSSGLRFAVWFSALLGLALSPFLGDAIPAHGGNAFPRLAHAAITLPGSWALYAFGLWAVIGLLLLLRVGIGVWRLHVLRETFVPVDPEEVDESVRAILKRGQSRVSLYTSDRVQVPAAIGFIDPVIVLPRWLLDELSCDELKQVLLHEMAHLRRRDSWTNLVQQVIKAFFFFHPAVWWIESKLSLEREMACDDAVLAQTASARAYAQCLTHIAEKTFLRRSLALAQAVLGRVRQTSMRVARILDATHVQSSKYGWRAAVSLATLLFVCAVIGANEPHLIAFQNAEPGLQNGIAEHVPVITPVSLKTVDVVAPGSFPRSNPGRVIAPPHGVSRIAPHFAAAKEVELLRSAKENRTSLHFAVASAAATPYSQMMASEAVFVVFENRGFGPGGQPIYEIEVVHVTVVRPSTSFTSSEILHKEI